MYSSRKAKHLQLNRYTLHRSSIREATKLEPYFLGEESRKFVKAKIIVGIHMIRT
jgi:hypothetical protein